MSIKKVLKKYYIRYSAWSRYRQWLKDCDKLRSGYRSIPFFSLPIEEQSLILVPHADDEWVGCSSIVRHSQSTVLVNMDMQGGDNPELHKDRYYELQYIASKHNCKLETLVNDKVCSLVSIFKKYNPTVIYVPFFFDWHEEHIQTMKVLKDALEALDNNFRIGMYQVSLPIIASKVTHACTFNEFQWNEKWMQFETVYKTQLAIPFRRFAISERIQGALCSSFAAEVFSFCNSFEWMANIDEWLLCESEISVVKKNLQNLFTVHNLLIEFSNKRRWISPK